jgi:long-chain acyl-CoA synthetase
MMLNHPSIDNYDLSSMDRFVVGAAPVPDELQKSIEEKLDVEVFEAYGLSEAGGTVTCTRPDMPRKSGSAGTPVDNVEIKLFDDDDNELPANEPGEIVVKGPMVMQGYFNKPEQTAEALKGGWLHTGDVGYADADGYLFITDRKKDMIIKGGENVYPSEIEDVLLRHPSIAEAAVVGIPDPKYGEEIMAFVVKAPGAELAEVEVIAHCVDNYTKFKSPSKVKFIDTLPKSMIGKVLKTELKKLI